VQQLPTLPSFTKAPIFALLALPAELCDIPGFIDRLRIELRLQGQLQGLDLKTGLVQQLLAQRTEDNADSLGNLRLDLSPMRQVQNAIDADSSKCLLIDKGDGKGRWITVW